MIQKFTVSRDDSIYEAFPDVTLTANGRLLCVFEECTHHGDRSWTRLALVESSDRSRTRDEPVLLPMQGIMPDKLIELSSGRWLTACHVKNPDSDFLKVWLWYSADQGKSWHGPVDVADQTVSTSAKSPSCRLMTKCSSRCSARIPPRVGTVTRSFPAMAVSPGVRPASFPSPLATVRRRVGSRTAA